MRRCLVTTTSFLIVALLSVVASTFGPAVAVDPAPSHSVTVSGAGSITYPVFSAAVSRYAVRPGAGSDGTFTVSAATSDPAGTVRVNGRPVTGGVATVPAAEAGDEISVLITDAAGVTDYSFIVLPQTFPVLERTVTAGSGPSAGHVLLTLGKWTSPGTFHETAVDANGVPAYVLEAPSTMDLQKQPNGNYSVGRGSGPNGADIVELDPAFQEVRRWRTRGLQHTDAHDAILLEDGTAYLMAYEPNEVTGLTDSVIQHVGADGDVLFEWNSADHVDIAAETVTGSNPDYAHINSFSVMHDGNLLASFRHFSSVFKIARYATADHQQGEVIWKLGGRASDFAFTGIDGQPDGGPCAQHTAEELSNGDIMVFDNGAWNINPLCVDPADVSGPPVARVPTRIAQWSLDEQSGVATAVKELTIDNRYAIFAGSSQPLDNGNVVVGWASSTNAVASELSPTGEVLWELVAPETPKYFTYRAEKVDVPDVIDPEATLGVPDDLSFDVGESVPPPSPGCTDRGGSSLVSCVVVGFDTSTAGARTVSVTATDGAGNSTTVHRSYTVTAAPVVVVPPATEQPTLQPPANPVVQPPATAPRHAPDLHARLPGGRWKGRDLLDVRRGQTVRTTSERTQTVLVRVQNDGTTADRFRMRIRGTDNVQGPRWVLKGRATGPLEPGESVGFWLTMRPEPGEPAAAVRVVARSVVDPEARDRVWSKTRWR